MSRHRDLVLLVLLVAATACGSTADTFDAVEPQTTPSSENADQTVPDTDSATVPATASDTSTDTGTVTEPAPPITGLSPQAVPGLSSVPRPPDPIETAPLDPDSARVQAAVDDLAARLDVPSSAVDIVSASAVTWGDSSLGCPQPGMQYLQSITDGSLVVLAVDGIDYRYTGGDPLQLCIQADRT